MRQSKRLLLNILSAQPVPEVGHFKKSLLVKSGGKDRRAKLAISPEHRLIHLASRQYLAVEFDRELQKVNGDYIAIRDKAGQVLYSGDLCVIALTWLAARARKQGRSHG